MSKEASCKNLVLLAAIKESANLYGDQAIIIKAHFYFLIDKAFLAYIAFPLIFVPIAF